MANAYFHLRERAGRSATYEADEATGGPWAADLQHGGPPNALLVADAERVAAAETGRVDLVAMRLAAEFVGPVPVAHVTTTATVVRAARTAVLVEVALAADGRDCLHGRVWFVATGDTAAVAPPLADPIEPPDGGPGMPAAFPYAQSIEWRAVRGAGLFEPGPAAVWARPNRPVLAGLPMSGLQRAALVGDSASGISSELDWQVWSFLNIDLDVHLARPIEGEWVFMDAATQLGPSGTGLTRSALADVRGPVGSTLQTLVVEPRRR